ncbi:MAG: hypothetical protein JWR72_2708 [Flavisolibacter sp.]|nr:hypothetical protein [Flavisolibacter sp.]
MERYGSTLMGAKKVHAFVFTFYCLPKRAQTALYSGLLFFVFLSCLEYLIKIFFSP